MNQGSKYHPLFAYLRQCGQAEVTLTLEEVEDLLGQPLPTSAQTTPAWWSNRSQGASQAAAWMGAGYHVERVDLAQGIVTFRRPPAAYTVQRRDDAVVWDGELVKALRDHMGLTQAEFADELGVRQPTVSEWETGAYAPKRSSSRLLSLIAERAGFAYG